MNLITAIFWWLTTFISGNLDNKNIPQEENLGDAYPQNYFLFPIAPGTTTSLSGTFGDLRVNHFHAGLDIRTGGVEGKSVFAAAEGYVSRIGISKGGYGNALYITHPNGYTTVYGHLKDFSAPIKAYLLEKQYASEQWEINLILQPGEIKVSKGELVALSGNTGGSGGPHLHFEIRDVEENTHDPALFGFKEVLDNQAPVIQFITLKTKSTDARINGKFGSFDFPAILGSDGVYRIGSAPVVWGDVAVEMYAYDKSQTSPFRLGVKEIELKDNGQTTYLFNLSKLAFHNKLDMNMHTDYDRMVETSVKVHKCYYEEGNSMKFYSYNDHKGVLKVSDGARHQIAIRLTDTYKNERQMSLELISNPNYTGIISSELGKSQYQKVELADQFIKIVRRANDSPLFLVDGNRTTEIPVAYNNGREEVFVHNLEDGIYTKYAYADVVFDIPVTDAISPQYPELHTESYDLNFFDKLYHEFFVNFKSETNKLSLDKDRIPLKGNYEVKWMPGVQKLSENQSKIYITDGKKPKFIGGAWNGNSITFTPRELGTFQVLTDKVPPTISPRTITPKAIVFRINDDLSGIKDFECRVNGKWILMEYEYKNGLVWAEYPSDINSITGELIFKVRDNSLNEAEFKTTIQ